MQLIERDAMENISLIIVTDDREYGRALSQALIHLCGGMLIQITGKGEFFSKLEECENGGGEVPFLESVDLILWDGEEAGASYGGRIVLLCDKPARAVKDFKNGRFSIYKYSQAQFIAASIFEIYSFLTGRHMVNIQRQNVHILAFSSWLGGSGCTVTAMAAAQELCRFRDKRVLYLSFEEVESTGEFMESPAGVKGVGVYLYHLFKNSSSVIRSGNEPDGKYPAIEGYLIRDDFGVEAFAPTSGRNPLRELTDDELNMFIASLIDTGRYDFIIMDVGNNLSKTDITCMEIAGKICMTVRREGNGSRENQYLQHLICCCGEAVIDKIVKAENFAVRQQGESGISGEKQEMISTDICIERSSTFLQTGEIKRIFLDGKYGNSIKLLVEKMTEDER